MSFEDLPRSAFAAFAMLAAVACSTASLQSPPLVSSASVGEPTDPEPSSFDAADRFGSSSGVCGDPSWLEPPTLKPVYVVFDGEVDCDQTWTLFAVGGYGWNVLLDEDRGRCVDRYGHRAGADSPPSPSIREYQVPKSTRKLVAAWSSRHMRAAGAAEYSLEPVPATLVAPVVADPVTVFVPLDPDHRGEAARLTRDADVFLQMILELRDPSALPDRFAQPLALPLEAFTEVDGGFELELRVPSGYVWHGWVRVEVVAGEHRIRKPRGYEVLYGLRGEVSDGRLEMVLDDSREPPSDAHRWPPFLR